MDGNCLSLTIESGKCGDEHYRGMKKWLRTRLNNESRDECYAHALIYRDSLEKLLHCLQNRQTSTRNQLRIDSTIEFQRLLARDIEILASHQGKRISN